MATKGDTTRHELSLAQQNAVDCLAAGQTDAETAEVTGVSRQTVNTWRNHDAAFIAALNTRRREIWGAAGDRLRAMLPTALDALERAIAREDADWRAAVRVLELAGLDAAQEDSPALGPQGIGPTDPEAVLAAEVRRRRGDRLAGLLDGGAIIEAEKRAVEVAWRQRCERDAS